MTDLVYSIPQQKITRHPLDIDHPRGASKAIFFPSRGFSTEDPDALASAFLHHASDHWPGWTAKAVCGQKHVVTGGLGCPDGTKPRIRAVWKVEADGSVASLVTAYPAHP